MCDRRPCPSARRPLRPAALAVAAALAAAPSVAQTPPVPPPTSQSQSVRIARVTVVGNTHVPTVDILAHLHQKGGAGPVNAAAVEDMGLFQSVKVTTAPDPAGGTDVICTVVENPVVRAIRVTADVPDGKPAIPEATLVAHMHTAVGRVLNTKTLAADMDALFDPNTGYAAAQGYYIGVSSGINIDPATGVLTIPLIEARVDKIEVRGNGTVPEAEVRAALGVRPGDVFRAGVLQEAAAHLGALHRFQEYQCQAVPGQPQRFNITVTLRTPRAPFGTLVPGKGRPATVAYGGAVGGAVVVPVRVNGRATGHFLLLTNNDLTVLSDRFAAGLGLTPQPMREGGRPYYIGAQPASAVALERLTLGGDSGAEVRGLSLPVSDLSALSAQIGQTVDGLLGADLLSRLAFALDLPRRRVTFWGHGSLSAAERAAAGFGGALRVPVGPLYGSSPVPAAEARIRGGAAEKSFPVMIATGHGTSMLPPADARALGLTPLPGTDAPATALARATRLTAGALSVAAPLFQLSDQAGGATLGMNVLGRYRVLLDEPGRAVFLAPEVTVAGTGPGRRPLAVPFVYDPVTTPYPVVQVSVNGRPPLPFIFDTGSAPALVLDRRAAQALGLPPDARRSQVINGSVPLQTAAVRTAVLRGRTRADDVHVSLEQAAVADLGDATDAGIGPRVAGFVGAGLLRDAVVRFDFPRRMLTFYPRGTEAPPYPGAVTLPLSERVHEENYLVTLAPPSGPPAALVVDTGSPNTTLPYEERAFLHPLRSRAGGQWMLGSVALGQDLLLPRLPFLGMPAGPAIVSVVGGDDTPAQWHPATLGNDVLSRAVFVLDVPHMRLLLGPAATPPALKGWSGARLVPDGGQFRVTAALPASPAGRAGLRAGDTLLSVDGRMLAGLSRTTAQRLADGLAGTAAAFTVRRAGEAPETVRFRRAAAADAPDSPLDGVFGVREGGSPLVVTAVLPECPAARAGLAAGDTVTTIDGRPTADMSADGWAGLAQKTRLTLTVVRAGVSRRLVLPPDEHPAEAPPARPSATTAAVIPDQTPGTGNGKERK